MKATGIVRRVDELGRIVIPKEIRRTLRIREGDPLEIFTSRDGELILKKYSPLNEMSLYSDLLIDAHYETSELIMLVCDNDIFISAPQHLKKVYGDKPVSLELERLIFDRKSYVAEKGDTLVPLKREDNLSEYTSQIILPIIGGGDCLGALVMLGKDGSLAEHELAIARATASYLSKQLD